MTDLMPSNTTPTNEQNNIEVNDNHPIEEWDDLDMDPLILRGIYAYGFENPSPIQKRD